MEKLTEWLTSKFQHPLSLLFFVLGALLILLGVSNGLNIPVLNQVILDPNYRWMAVVIGCVSCLLAVAMYYRPPKASSETETNKARERQRGKAKDTLSAQSFFLNLKEIEAQEPLIDLIERSEDLFIGGVALGFAAKRHRSQLQNKLEKGCRLRFLLLDPDSPEVNHIAKMFEIPPEQVRNDILATLKNMEALGSKATTSQTGSLEVRLTSHEPSFSFVISDPKRKNGAIRGSFRVYGHSSTTRPNWIVRAQDPWFLYLIESCENLWIASQVWRNQSTKPVIHKAGVVAYRLSKTDEPEVLVITARINPQQWIFPVGNVDPGETLQQAAVRECREESGYVVEIDSKIAAIERESSLSVSQMTFFMAKVVGQVDEYEVDRKREWVHYLDLGEFVTEDFMPIARAAITQLSSHL